MDITTLDELELKGKVVLCRVDLNVPMRHGKVEDHTRITRLKPTIDYLIKKNAKVVLLSHFGRPKGAFDLDMSLAPLTNALSEVLDERPIKFAVDCIGEPAKEAVANLENGEVLLLENVRFHPGEEANDPEFAKELASLGDIYVNDTFSCSHRDHASLSGVANFIPSAAGLLLQSEIENVSRILRSPEKPMATIVGGAKVSTKLSLLHALVQKMDLVVVGGAMANTFLKAQGLEIGASLYEPDLVVDAKVIMDEAVKHDCEVFVPKDVVVAPKLEVGVPCQVVPVTKVPKDQMILDIGPQTAAELGAMLHAYRTLAWNGPLGAFEYRPFDVGTITVARHVASLSGDQRLTTIAGGGDVVAALAVSGLTDTFTYISTAGGAFLQWLEGRPLPGVEALRNDAEKKLESRA